MVANSRLLVPPVPFDALLKSSSVNIILHSTTFQNSLIFKMGNSETRPRKMFLNCVCCQQENFEFKIEENLAPVKSTRSSKSIKNSEVEITEDGKSKPIVPRLNLKPITDKRARIS